MDLQNNTHSLVLNLLVLAALKRNAMTLVLEALRSDQPLDLGGLGVRLLALTFRLDLSSNDVLSNLFPPGLVLMPPFILYTLAPSTQNSADGPSHTLPGLPLPPPQLQVGDD